MKKPIAEREAVLLAFLGGEISKHKAADILSCTIRTIENYRNLYRKSGQEGLRDHRHSNYCKLTQVQKDRIKELKSSGRWRSARNVRDKLNLSVNESTVFRVFKKEGLIRENIKRVKAIIRFEADYLSSTHFFRQLFSLSVNDLRTFV